MPSVGLLEAALAWAACGLIPLTCVTIGTVHTGFGCPPAAAWVGAAVFGPLCVPIALVAQWWRERGPRTCSNLPSARALRGHRR